MAIRRSSAPQTAALITDLTGNDAVRREAALARLAIAGARAVDPLLHALPAASGAAQAAILRALEMIAEPRTLPASIAALRVAGHDVALAAVGAVRAQLRLADPPTADGSLEALTSVAIDASRSQVVRVAVIDALSDCSPTCSTRFGSASRESRRDASDAAGLDGPAQTDIETPALRLEAAAGGEADDPDVLAAAVARGERQHRALDPSRFGAGFQATRALGPRRDDAGLEAARAAAHVALARAAAGWRSSICGMRSNEAGDAALETFVRAAALVGDASCLEPLAAAWRRAAADGQGARSHAPASRSSRASIYEAARGGEAAATRFPDAAPVLTTT